MVQVHGRVEEQILKYGKGEEGPIFKSHDNAFVWQYPVSLKGKLYYVVEYVVNPRDKPGKGAVFTTRREADIFYRRISNKLYRRKR